MRSLITTRQDARSGCDYLLLRVEGELSCGNVDRLRAAMLKCMAERPPALIIQLDALRVADRTCLAVFHALARRVAQWPGCPVVLAAAPPEVASQLVRLGVGRRLPICRSMDEAVRVVQRGGSLPQLSERLAPVLDSVPVARWLTVRACERWGMSTVSGPAGQVVTELVGDAVRHSETPIDLVLTCARPRLHIAVHDRVPRLPRQRNRDTAADNGGGLLVVAALASGHGVARTPQGKVTWAIVSAGSLR